MRDELLRRAAVLFWSLGTVLLLSFFATTAWTDRAGEQAIRDFHAVRELAIAQAATPASARLEAGVPDQTLWSATRIRQYADESARFAELPEGVLTIPSVGVRVPVYGGTEDASLAVGAGRIEGTPEIGAAGNVGIAAHRDGHFRGLKDIEPGAAVLVETLDGHYRYEVTGTAIVQPEDVHVLDWTAEPSLTLVTCYPFYFAGSAPQRFIVRARLSAMTAE